MSRWREGIRRSCTVMGMPAANAVLVDDRLRPLNSFGWGER